MVVAVGFTGCATLPDTVHTTEFRDIVLTPQHRTNADEQVTLIAITHAGRVTIRSRRRIYSARVGEYFTQSGKGGIGYTLKSIDRDSGRVVITGETRIYGDPSSPLMIAR